MDWKQFKQFPADTSFQAAEAENALFPASPAEAVKALKLLQKDESETLANADEFNRIKNETDVLVADLYKSRKQ